MSISINISQLRVHLFHIHQEQDEVSRLLRILDEWECADSGNNRHFFFTLRCRLEKQRDMINSRLEVLETMIDEFSMCIYTIERELQEANLVLDQLDF